MLKKANRLKSQRDFKRALNGRRLCINDCFVVYGLALPSAPAGPFSAGPMQPRIGFIVSKKVHKKSAHRNRIKRHLRELIRLCLKSEQCTGLERYRALVFIARAGSVEASYRQLQQKMERCLQQI